MKRTQPPAKLEDRRHDDGWNVVTTTHTPKVLQQFAGRKWIEMDELDNDRLSEENDALFVRAIRWMERYNAGGAARERAIQERAT